MGKFINFCAGASIEVMPSQNVRALLLNVLDHGANDRKIRISREMQRMAGPKYVMLDSSGYQLHVAENKGKRITFDSSLPMKHSGKEINLTPKHVMEAASIIRPDIVVGLDFPIRKVKTDAEKETEFLKKLDYNVRWAFESTAEWKERCPEVQFFLPIQCYDLTQLDLFLGMTGGLDHDGVSMPIRELKIQDVALFLVSFYQRGIRQIHLLGTFSFPVIALCAYMARHLFEWVSLDATTWRFAADKGEFLNPYNLSRVRLQPKIKIQEDAENKCPCPFCDGLNFATIEGLERRNKISLLREHNWWSVCKVFSDLEGNCTDIVALKKFMLPNCRTSRMMKTATGLIETLGLVDIFKDSDIGILKNLLGSEPIKKKKTSPRLQTVPA
jgi:tRNA-guanine family transglycosylase